MKNNLIKAFQLGSMLGWQDVRQAYRRSSMGPFWITAGMAVQIATMGLVFALIFKTNIQEYLPFLATSIIIWGFISTTINEGCQSFIMGEAIIKQLNLPLILHTFRTIWKNLINLAHNIVILPIVFLAVWYSSSWTVISVVFGLAILILNLTWMALLLGILSVRYRDMPPIVNSLLTITFYLTPVMWYPSLIGNNQTAHFLLGLNPFYHLIQIVRLPILGQWPTLENWGLSILFAIVGLAFSAVIFKKFRTKIAYWV